MLNSFVLKERGRTFYIRPIQGEKIGKSIQSGYAVGISRDNQMHELVISGKETFTRDIESMKPDLPSLYDEGVLVRFSDLSLEEGEKIQYLIQKISIT